MSQVTQSNVAVQSPSAWTPSPCLEHSSLCAVPRPRALAPAVKVRDSGSSEGDREHPGPQLPWSTFPSSPSHPASSWATALGTTAPSSSAGDWSSCLHLCILSFSWTFPTGIKCMEKQIPTKQHRDTRVEEMNVITECWFYLGFTNSFGWDCLAGPQSFCFFRLNQLLWFPRGAFISSFLRLVLLVDSFNFIDHDIWGSNRAHIIPKEDTIPA